MLLARGSEPSAVNGRGEEPWEAAIANSQHQCAELIKGWPNLDEGQLDDFGADASLEGEMEIKSVGSVFALIKQEEAQLECAATRSDEPTACPDTSSLL